MTRYHVRTDGSMGVCIAREGNRSTSRVRSLRRFLPEDDESHVLKVLRSSSIQLGSGVKLCQPS